MAKKEEAATKQGIDKSTAIVGIAMAVIIALGVNFAVDGQSNSGDDGESQAQSQSAEQTIVEIASSNDDLSTLAAAVTAADLVDTLNGDGPFTVFAPANSAFEALPDGTLDDLLKPENKQALADILTYHVVPAKALAADLTDGQTLETVLGKTLTVAIDGDEVRINGAKVVTADVEASNGVAHVIDTVLLPTNTVVDIAIDNDFETLVAAVAAADLVDTLNSEGPFTVFAPTDDAFAALPEGTLDDLLKPENKQKLADILTYHVVAGKVTAEQVIALDGQNVDTILGQEWHVLVEGGEVFIANPVTAEKIAKVLQTDIIGDNGIVHVIDSVLLPQ